MSAAGACRSLAAHGPAVNAAPHSHPEPVSRWTPGTGSGLSASFAPVLERVERWAGPRLEALLLSGSHASGEAVWVEVEGRTLSLSDLDLYAVMRDDAAVAAAERARAATPAADLAPVLDAAGLAAPLEVAFITRAGLSALPARPGTVELARAARVLKGDPGVLDAIPRWQPADVGREERLRLLENRGFELLWAWNASGPGLARLRARHAILKTALDLAAARCLAAGELPARAAEKVARARALGVPAALPSWLEGAWDGLEPLWEQALAWRAGSGARAEDPAPDATWRAAARGWCAAWWAESASESRATEPWERALALAARGSLARRWRRALAPDPARSPELAPEPAAAAPARAPLFHRLRHAPAGTPILRVHGTGVVLLLAAAQSAREPALPSGALRALRRLGVTREARFDAARAQVLAAWGRAVP